MQRSTLNLLYFVLILTSILVNGFDSPLVVCQSFKALNLAGDSEPELSQHSVSANENNENSSSVAYVDYPTSTSSANIRKFYGYINEQTVKFKTLVQDDSLDERLANLNFVIKYISCLNNDFFTVNTGDENKNRQAEQEIAGSKVDNSLCGQHLGQMLELLDQMGAIQEERRRIEAIDRPKTSNTSYLNEAHYRLARVVDSMARYEGGVLSGRYQFPGSYRQCQGTQMLLGGKRVASRYCLAKLRPSDSRLNPLLRSMHRPSDMADPNLWVGTCLPQSCHTKSFRLSRNKELARQLVKSHFQLPKSLFIEENLQFDSVFCYPDADSAAAKIPLSGKLLIIFIFTWVSMCIYATWKLNCSQNADVQNPIARRLCQSLDLRKSWRDFTLATGSEGTDSSKTTRRVELDTLNCVKVFCCMIVIAGHSHPFIILWSTDVTRASRYIEYHFWSAVAIDGQFFTDTFSLISGMLVTFITLGKLDKMGYISRAKTSVRQFLSLSFKLFMLRYIRLVPLYALVFWYKKSLNEFMGFEMPLWDHGLNQETLAGGCRDESWLSPFTFMASYLPLSKQCMPHCWSVVNDMASMVVLGPIILLLARHPVIGATLSAVIGLMGMRAMVIAWSNMDPNLRLEMDKLRVHAVSQLFKRNGHLYSNPYYRISSVLIGALAGYALYHYNKADKLKDWPVWFKGLATKTALITVPIILFIPPSLTFISDSPILDVVARPGLVEIFSTVGRLIWTISNAVILMRMTTDWKDKFLMQVSAGKFWKIMSTLNYVILLIHVDVVMFDVQNQLVYKPFSTHGIFNVFATSYLICYSVGLVLHLIFENPIDKLIKSYSIGENRVKAKKAADKSK